MDKKIIRKENTMSEKMMFFGKYFLLILNGYLVTKLIKHVDTIKDSDDHTPGIANAFKLGGLSCGIIAVVLELLKGFLPVYIATFFVNPDDYLFILVMLAPVVGHAYPLYYGFKKGGKCIAASFGVFLGLIPNLLPVLILAFWFIFFSVVLIINPHALRTVVTYICWMVTMIFATIFIIKSIPILLSTILVGAMVIFRHNKALKEIEEKEIKFIFKRGQT